MIDFETVSFYDPLGNLVSQTFSGVTTSYQIDPIGLGNVVASFDSGGILTAHYAYGFGLVSQVSAAGIQGFYDFNNIGSALGITGTNGSYINKYAYVPFGQTITLAAADSNPFTFAGQLGPISDGAGTLEMRARSYDPEIGQFMSNDPLGLAGGTANIRVYADNNPLRLSDPSGMEAGIYYQSYCPTSREAFRTQYAQDYAEAHRSSSLLLGFGAGLLAGLTALVPTVGFGSIPIAIGTAVTTYYISQKVYSNDAYIDFPKTGPPNDPAGFEGGSCPCDCPAPDPDEKVPLPVTINDL